MESEDELAAPAPKKKARRSSPSPAAPVPDLAPPTGASSSAPAPSSSAPVEFHNRLCARLTHCCLGYAGKVPTTEPEPRRLASEKWFEKRGAVIRDADGEIVNRATFDAAMVWACADDLRHHYRRRLIAGQAVPNVLEFYRDEEM